MSAMNHPPALLPIRGLGDATLDPRFVWHNEPENYRVERGSLMVEPAAKTDFWSRIHNHPVTTNGHFAFVRVPGSLRMSVTVGIAPKHQYDQAGLMVWFSEACWLKCSAEYEPGHPSRLGAVVTNSGYSDWSTQDVPADLARYALRVTRENCDYLVEASLDGRRWTQLRVAHLLEDTDPNAAAACGVYACCPKAAGFTAHFDDFSIVDAAQAEPR